MVKISPQCIAMYNILPQCSLARPLHEPCPFKVKFITELRDCGLKVYRIIYSAVLRESLGTLQIRYITTIVNNVNTGNNTQEQL